MKKGFINKRNNQEIHFDSFAEFANEVKMIEDNNIKTKRSMDSSKSPESENWDLNTGFTHALDMAVNGEVWIEGAKQLQQACIDSPLIMNVSAQEELELDRIGACVDIGEYLNNSPDCFLKFEPIETKKPVVKIVATLAFSARMKSHQIINRGRAILACIESLENKGYRVELTGLIGFLDFNVNKGLEIYFKLKGENDVYSAQTLAFALAHPVIFRRLGFRMAEAHNAAITRNRYGAPFKLKNSGYDIVFNWGTDGFHTPNEALKTAQNTVNAFIANN